MPKIKIPAVYDTSHHETINDFAALDPKPVMMITKATEGSSFVDGKFSEYYPAIAAAGYARGCFHFHRKAAFIPSIPYSQAKFFCNTIASFVADDDVLVLDVEEGGETAAMLVEWVKYVQYRYPKNPIWIYSRKNILDPIPTALRLLGFAAPRLADRLHYGQHPLNEIMLNESDREILKNIPIWTAGYPENPDLYDEIPSWYIPDQTRFGPPILWQYSASGVVGGVKEFIDLNMGTPLLFEMISKDEKSNLFDGIERITGSRHGWNFSMIISDPAKVDFEVIKTPMNIGTSVAAAKMADILWNGGNPNKYVQPWQPDDYSVTNGFEYIKRKSAVPSLIVTGDGKLHINHGQTQLPDIQQALSGVRYLVENGKNVIPPDGTEPKYTEGHSRSIHGITAAGHHLCLSSQGAYPNQGLKLFQAAEIMIAFGAVTAFDSGGGGDVTEVINGELTNQPENPNGAQRYLPQFLAVYAKEKTPMANGIAQEAQGNTAKIRNAASRHGKEVGILAARSKVEFVRIVPTVKLGPADKDQETWLELPDGNFVNYQLFNTLNVLTNMFVILQQPTEPPTEPQPPADIADMPIHLEFGGGDSPYELAVVDIVVKAKPK